MGDVPTEPGDYRWRPPGAHDYRLVKVYQQDARGELRIQWGARDVGPAEGAAGIWGERIPGNAVLKARRELCMTSPHKRVYAEDAGKLICGICGKVSSPGEPMHADDCMWLRAQGD